MIFWIIFIILLIIVGVLSYLIIKARDKKKVIKLLEEYNEREDKSNTKGRGEDESNTRGRVEVIDDRTATELDLKKLLYEGTNESSRQELLPPKPSICNGKKLRSSTKTSISNGKNITDKRNQLGNIKRDTERNRNIDRRPRKTRLSFLINKKKKVK